MLPICIKVVIVFSMIVGFPVCIKCANFKNISSNINTGVHTWGIGGPLNI